MKKIICILALMLLILSVSAVSASDIEASDKLAGNESGASTFNDIQTSINNANDNDVIELEDYYSGEKEVSVSKSVTIKGSSQITTLDGKNVSRAFNVKSGDVTFKNLKFINCVNDKGGAVFSNANCIFINCIFIDNHAGNGGAIYSQGNLTIKNSIFSDNTAGECGGVIYSYSAFTKHKNFHGNLNIKNSKFIGNTANSGGAIKLDYDYSKYKSLNHGNTNINNCQFIKNTAEEYGGVISYSGRDYGKLTIKYSSFDKNSAKEGGVLFTSSGVLTVSKCNFTNNQAKSGILAIDFSDDTKIEKSNFINNTADTISAVKLFFSKVTVTDCKFQKNSLGVLNAGEESKLTVINNNKKTTYSQITVLDNSFKKIIPIKAIASNFVSRYHSGEKFYITLKNIYNSKPVVEFQFNVVLKSSKKGKSYFVKTNSESKARILCNRYLHPGKYKVTFKSEDWSEVSGSSVYVTIKKAKATVKAPKAVNKYKKSQYFKAKIINKASKKPADYIKVKVKIYTGKKAKTYTKKTNGNGVVKINTKKLSKGLHKVIIKSGNKDYKISKKSSIKIK